MEKKPTYVIYDPRLGNVAKNLFLLLEEAQHFNLSPTLKDLAATLDVTTMTVTRGLRELEECGWIERKHIPGICNTYTLHQQEEFRKEVVVNG